jgi:hypothetical protein
MLEALHHRLPGPTAFGGVCPDGAERERLWAMAVDNYSGYERYQVRAGDRTIPVVALRPR